MSYAIIIPAALLTALSVAGQVKPPAQSATDQLSERIIPSGDADLNYEDLYETLAQMTSSPLDVNRATRDDLLSLGLLSQQQAGDLIAYRDANGPLLEIYELQAIGSFDLGTIRSLLPFLRAGPATSARSFTARIRSQGSAYFFTRYERTVEMSHGFSAEADSASRYTGGPERIYSKFRFTSPGDLSVGVTAEKDAGEKMVWTTGQRAFDFYSAHVQLANKGPLTNLIVGDYVAQFGQGLTLGGGYGIGKGSETITTLRRVSTGFMPYSSANESGFFRGVAATAKLPGKMIVHAFASSLSRDASTSEESTLAVLQSGKHRTPNELAGRHRLSEKNYGAAIEYKGRTFEGGGVVHRTAYEAAIHKSPTVYNTFDFAGSGNMNAGAFGSYTLGSFSVFGELAHTLGHGSGWVAGILGSISRTIDLSVLMRSYALDYFTFYSNALSENTAPRNERGIYWGWKHAINRRLSYTAYTDIFIFPWLKFRSYRPSAGSESLVRYTYRPSKAMSFFFQFRDERKVRNVPLETPVYRASPGIRKNWTIGSDLTMGDLSLRSRVQFSSYRQYARTNGFAIAFDASYDWRKVSIDTRVAIFDTDDFDNRQYMNERDVLMAFSFPAYYGEGTRTYVVGRFQPAKWLDLSVKLATTSYFNSVTSGSGGDRIDGNKRHDVKVQVIFRAD